MATIEKFEGIEAWQLRGFDYLAKVITGIKFKDGIEVPDLPAGRQVSIRPPLDSTFHTPDLTITLRRVSGYLFVIVIDLMPHSISSYYYAFGF
jgi:hypothetical protein